MDGVEGALEITMRAGDCLLFVDCLTQGQKALLTTQL